MPTNDPADKQSLSSFLPHGEASAFVLLALGLLPLSAGAGPIMSSMCPGQTGADRTSAVLDSVDNTAQNEYVYSYGVCNTSGPSPPGSTSFDMLVDWELPFDGTGDGMTIGENAADIRDIVTPEGWEWSIEKRGEPNAARRWEGTITWQDPMDPFYSEMFADHEYVLHFYAQGLFASISEGQFKDGFGFTADVGPIMAPYQASWFDQPPTSGDPAFPGAIPNTSFGVPEPATLALLAAGLGLGAAGLRRRKREPGGG